MSKALPVYPSRRPATRAECAGMPRPCPFVSCRHSLLTEVNSYGKLVIYRGRKLAGMTKRDVPGQPVLPVPDPGPTCALDEAEGGPQTLEEIGAVLGVTRERARQLENKAYARFLANGGHKLVAGQLPHERMTDILRYVGTGGR